MAMKLSNNATSQLAGAIDAADTAISVTAGDGSKFPSLSSDDWFPATIVDANKSYEIVKVTARTDDLFTVVRAQEGTAALSFAAGSRIDIRLTLAVIMAFLQKDENLGDLSDVVAARTNLGLGNSATKNVGNTAGTVAAGDDQRIIDGGWSTGDIRPTLRTVAKPNWVMADDGTIGPTSSVATHKGDEFYDLYVLIWTNIDDSFAPVTGGRGSTADGDWASGKPLALTKMLGRALAAAGAGAGLTGRSLGEYLGEEAHALTADENGPHTHGINQEPHSHQYTKPLNSFGAQAGGDFVDALAAAGSDSTSGASITISLQQSGAGTAHENMQPTIFVNFEIKL